MTLSGKKIWAVLGILGATFFVLFPPEIQAAPRRVVFIRYRITPGHFASVVEDFKKGMTLRGYKEGPDIEYVDVLTRSDGEDSIPDVIAAVEKYKGSADMFITCGWVSMYARGLLKETKVPQLFVPVLNSVALEMLPSLTAPPKTNLSGIYLMYPPEKILRLAKFIIPNIKKYAYVYDSRIPADAVYKKAYESLASGQKLGLTLSYIDLAQGVDKAVTSLKKLKIDAFGGIIGSFKYRDALARANIPVITSFTLDINQESIKDYADDVTVAGLFNPFDYCGAQGAEMTADIFEGKKTIGDTIPRPARQIAFINLKAAKHLNLPISFETLESVDIIVK